MRSRMSNPALLSENSKSLDVRNTRSTNRRGSAIRSASEAGGAPVPPASDVNVNPASSWRCGLILTLYPTIYELGRNRWDPRRATNSENLLGPSSLSNQGSVSGRPVEILIMSMPRALSEMSNPASRPCPQAKLSLPS